MFCNAQFLLCNSYKHMYLCTEIDTDIHKERITYRSWIIIIYTEINCCVILTHYSAYMGLS